MSTQALITKIRHLPLIAKGVAAAVAMATALVMTSGPAGASTPPVTYPMSNSCIRLVDGNSGFGLINTNRPVAVAHYTGTTEVYWSGQLQMLIQGVWYVVGSYNSAYATIWGYSGTQLAPIYWGNTANNYGVQFKVPLGSSYRVVGQTYWWNGKSWFASDSRMVAGCNF